MSERRAGGSGAGRGEDRAPIHQDIARFRAILFDALLKPHDMTMAQGWVLVHLTREDGLTQSELAARLAVAPVTTSRLIDRLEARGYVERRTDPGDRRSNRVHATPRAREIVGIMTRTAGEVERIATRGIAAADLETARAVLERMRANLRAALAGR